MIIIMTCHIYHDTIKKKLQKEGGAGISLNPTCINMVCTVKKKGISTYTKCTDVHYKWSSSLQVV